MDIVANGGTLAATKIDYDRIVKYKRTETRDVYKICLPCRDKHVP